MYGTSVSSQTPARLLLLGQNSVEYQVGREQREKSRKEFPSNPVGLMGDANTDQEPGGNLATIF